MTNRDLAFYVTLAAFIGIWTFTSVFDDFMELPPSNARESVMFEQIKPILKEKCLKCHSNMAEYSEAYKKRFAIRDRVWVNRTMPLGGVMRSEDRVLVRNWVDDGARQ